MLSQAMERDLSAWARVRLRLHLMVCDACSNFDRQLKLLRKAVARLVN